MILKRAALMATLIFALAPSAAGTADRHHIRPLWVADAICETGHNPPNWRFHAGVYEGGIAFYWGTWQAWHQHVREAVRYRHAYQAPAWVQAQVAEYGLDHYGRWGCLFHAEVWRLR